MSSSRRQTGIDPTAWDLLDQTLSYQLADELHAGLWANLFNIRYRMLPSYLAHTYSPLDATGVEHRQGVVINRMFGEMYNLRTIASILTRRPLNAAGGAQAGAPFQPAVHSGSAPPFDCFDFFGVQKNGTAARQLPA